MARPAASPQQRQQQRDLICQAAATIYQEHGAQGTTVRAVCKEAGISTGTLYSYFANLEALMQSLWIEPVQRADSQLEAIAVAHTDPIVRAQVLLEAYVTFAQSQPEVFRGAMLFVRPPAVTAPEPEPPTELAFYRLLRTAVVEGQTQDRFRSGDPDVLTQVLWAAVHGALALPVNIDRYALRPAADLAAASIELVLSSAT